MKLLASALLLSLVSSCALFDDTPPIEDYTLCFLVTDQPAAEFSDEVLGTAMAGHFDNIARLGREQLLLMAGPLGEPRSDPLHRGIFLFDIDSVEAAEKLVRTDPAVAAGVFAPRVYPYYSAAPFRELPRLEEESLTRRRLEDPEAEEWVGRTYVLVSCPDGAGAEAALAHWRDPLVLFSGRLGGELEGTGLFALNLSKVDEARRVVELAGPGLEWSFHPWWGTQVVEEFAYLPPNN